MAFPIVAAALGLAEFAPAIAKWLSGDKSQDMAQRVVDIAKSVTKTETPLEALQLIGQESQLLREFQQHILRMEQDMEVAYLTDRQSARARDIAITSTGHINHRSDIMVVSAALGLLMCLCSLAYFADHLPGEAVGIISTIAGIFGACLKDAYAFEFGSSRGSKEKDSTVANLLERG